MRSTTPVLFDAHAILKWTQQEEGYLKVKSLLRECQDGRRSGYMCEINLGEVYCQTIRAAGAESAKAFLRNFFRLPVTFVLPDRDLIRQAAEIKAAYCISYADCFAAATAIRHEASILTGDPEFKKLEAVVAIEWL